MGFNSQDDLINEITNNGKFYKADFTKTVNLVAVAGRCYDAGMYTGSPLIQTYGDIVKNGLLHGSLYNWTADGTGYAYGANTVVKTSGTATTFTADSIQKPLVNGRVYRVSFTITARTSGTVTVSVGGTSGTGRASAATFVEYITAGATQAVLFTITDTAVLTFGNISITEWGAGATSISGSALAPLKFSNSQGGIYHGGDVGPDSKHLLNLDMLTSTATGVPSQIYLVDVLAVYPFLDANSLSSQTLTNNLNVLEDFTVGTNDILTHTFYELQNLTRIRLTTTGTLPTGVTTATDYFVIKLTDTTCKLASSYANAVAGTAISITSGTGSGTHTINCLLPRYTNGQGVRAYIVSAGTSYSGGQLTGTVGAVAHNFSLSYTDSENNSGNSLPVVVSATASANNGHITHAGVAANNYGPFLPLSAGDNGIRSVETFQLSAASGTANTFYHLVLCRPITQIPLAVVSQASSRDLVNQLPSMPRIYDDANLSMIVYTGAAFAASGVLIGSAEFGWG